LYATLLADARFHDLLLAIDRDLADAARAEGCACGGRRHMARYRRKPRGRPCRLGSEHDQRFSFCCAIDGCRSRATPPSLRFLGRRVYVATVVVLIAILQHGVSDARLERSSCRARRGGFCCVGGRAIGSLKVGARGVRCQS